MKDHRLHQLSLEGIVACYAKDIKGSIERAKREAEQLYVTWRPDEVTCLACQAAMAQAKRKQS